MPRSLDVSSCVGLKNHLLGVIHGFPHLGCILCFPQVEILVELLVDMVNLLTSMVEMIMPYCRNYFVLWMAPHEQHNHPSLQGNLDFFF